jgi:glucose/galactose transporter
MAYFFLAIPASMILKKTGFKNGMSLGLFVMALGALMFIPAASSRSFELFLAGLFVQGMGLALLQTAVNPYVSIIGPIESAAARISIMGICNKIAGMLAPIVFGAILLGKSDEIEAQLKVAVDKTPILQNLAERIVMPYMILTTILILLAIGIKYSSLPEINVDEDDSNDGSNDTTSSGKTIFDYPYAIAGAFAIFFYVGAEVMAGDIIGTYGKNLGFKTDETKYFTVFTLVSMLIGYLVSLVLIPKYVKQEVWLLVSAVIGIFLTIASYFLPDMQAVTAIAALGFANAVMWPAIFPLGIGGLGRLTQLGSALLIMGIAGGAIVPPIYGMLSTTSIGFRGAFMVVMMICYLYILWFGTAGYKLGKK